MPSHEIAIDTFWREDRCVYRQRFIGGDVESMIMGIGHEDRCDMSPAKGIKNGFLTAFEEQGSFTHVGIRQDMSFPALEGKSCVAMKGEGESHVICKKG